MDSQITALCDDVLKALPLWLFRCRTSPPKIRLAKTACASKRVERVLSGAVDGDSRATAPLLAIR